MVFYFWIYANHKQRYIQIETFVKKLTFSSKFAFWDSFALKSYTTSKLFPNNIQQEQDASWNKSKKIYFKKTLTPGLLKI